MGAKMRYARVRDNRIVDLMHGTVEEAPRWHSEDEIAGFVAVPDHVRPSWIFVDNTWQPDPALAPPPPNSDDVRAEAQRRIIARTGANDLQSAIIKQLNAQMRATELVMKRASGVAWSEDEMHEAAALQTLADDIKAIRAASNVLEAMERIPDDYQDARWWR